MPDYVLSSQEIAIGDKIERDLELEGDARRLLGADRHLQALFDRYRMELSRSREFMLDTGVVGCCTECARSTGFSGCCGRGIENWYDEILILVNLLMGVRVPSERHNRSGCLFLGPYGCTLKARYHFCVNYLCDTLKERLSDREAVDLGRQAGRELSLCLEIEQSLRKGLYGKFC